MFRLYKIQKKTYQVQIYKASCCHTAENTCIFERFTHHIAGIFRYQIVFAIRAVSLSPAECTMHRNAILKYFTIMHERKSHHKYQNDAIHLHRTLFYTGKHTNQQNEYQLIFKTIHYEKTSLITFSFHAMHERSESIFSRRRQYGN